MSAVVGQRVTRIDSPDAPRLPARTKATPPMLYMHHPHRWQFFEDSGEWLPLLGKLKQDPGVAGVKDTGNTDLAVAQYTRKGWTMIRPSDERLGQFMWYVQRIPRQGGGSVHCDVSLSVEVIGSRAFWQEDPEGFRSFLRHIVKSGIIAPMNDNVKRVKVEDQRNVVERLEGSCASQPHNNVLLAKLERARKRLAGMTGTPKKTRTQKPRQKVTSDE